MNFIVLLDFRWLTKKAPVGPFKTQILKISKHVFRVTVKTALA